MSELLKLDKKVININVKEKAGVYQIRCYAHGKPLRISRLVGVDKLGILSIGSSSNLKRRLKQFIDGMKKGSGHSSGNRYHYLELDDPQMLGKYGLIFLFKYSNDYQQEEARLLIGYTDYFGELPPLNSQDCKYDYYGLHMKEYPRSFNW